MTDKAHRFRYGSNFMSAAAGRSTLSHFFDRRQTRLARPLTGGISSRLQGDAQT